jgi:type IV pilus assembly protein PilC
MTTTATHKHLFYSEMAKLLGAGFDIRKAAKVLVDTKLPAGQLALLKDLNQGLDSGGSITESFSKDTDSISQLERSIIDAGERGGKLGPAFQHLADYFGMLASTRRSAIQSMLYPLVMLHMGIFIGTVPTALMEGKLAFGSIVLGFFVTLFVIYLCAYAIYLFIRAVLKMAPENAKLDQLINRLPWIGKARQNMAMARFCRVYHSCLLAGIPMTETVKLSSEASQSGMIRGAGEQLALTAKAGQALGPQFLAADAIPKAFARSYSTGEEAGTLDDDLGRWANVFQSDAESSTKQVGVMLPKLLYALIVVFVGWKIINFFNSYYAQLDNIGN